MRKRPGVSWGAHEVSVQRSRRWLRKAIAPVVIAALAALGYFVVIPQIQERQYAVRLATAKSLADEGPVEDGIEKYKRIEADAAGTEAAETAARARVEIERYAAVAAASKRRADEEYHKTNYEAALKLYRETAEKYPLSRSGRDALAEEPQCLEWACRTAVGKGDAAAAARNWTEAGKFYQSAVALDPNAPGAKAGVDAADAKVKEWHGLLKAAEAAEKSGDGAGAVALYERAHELAADAPGTYEGRCRALALVKPPPGMRLIPPGEFEVGDESEPPVGKMTTNGFFMDITEVSNRQYGEFVAGTGHPPPPNWGGNQPPEKIRDLPAVCVNWDDADAYARWAGKRLPTGAEWERAARGPSGRKYPWGDSFKRSAGAFARAPSPVGRMPEDKSAEGCMDMAGNVSEWVADDVAAARPFPDRRANDATQYKAVRGASWAGIESGRSERVAPVGIATASSDPARTVLVDKPGVRGIEVRAFVETEFFFRGGSKAAIVIQVRKWNPQTRKFVMEDIAVAPGGRIMVEQPSPDPRTPWDTGCRLVRAEDLDDPLKARIIYVDDADKREHVMELVRPSELESPKVFEPAPGSDEWQAFTSVISKLSSASLADTARSAHRLCAPREARYVNCGFRCAKDAP